MITEAIQQLQLAEQHANELFIAAEERALIVAGKLESELRGEIVALAKDVFGIEEYWHKKIVRTGINTLYPYNGNPPDRMIEKGDILFTDFGPVYQGYEADIGRTYVLGTDPLKLKLKNDVALAWQLARDWYFEQTELTGAVYFNYLTALAKQFGWAFGGDIGGHIVGLFPHEQPADPNDMGLDIHPANHSSILVPDQHGNSRQWVLEIHFIDRTKNIGGFFEQLLQ